MAQRVTSSSDIAVYGDFVARRGDTFKRYIQFKKNGVEEKLSTSTFAMQVKSTTQTILEFKSSNVIATQPSITLQDVNGGVLLLQVPAALMKTYEPGTYEYDLQETRPDGTVITRLEGAFTITRDITVTL